MQVLRRKLQQTTPQLLRKHTLLSHINNKICKLPAKNILDAKHQTTASFYSTSIPNSPHSTPNSTHSELVTRSNWKTYVSKTLKWLMLIPIMLVASLVLVYFVLVHLYLPLLKYLEVDNPASRFYNANLKPFFVDSMLIIEGFHRFIRTYLLIISIGLDYFIVGSRYSPLNYFGWFGKTEEEKQKKKKELHVTNANRLLELFKRHKGVFVECCSDLFLSNFLKLCLAISK